MVLVGIKEKIAIVVGFSVLTLGIVTGILIFVYTYKVQEVVCEVNPFSNDQNSPLLVLAGSTKLLYPEWGDTRLRIAQQQTVDYICPGTEIYLGERWRNRSILSGFCRSGTEFRVGSGITNWEVLRCKDSFERIIRRSGTTCAGGNGTILESGYEISDGTFINILTICFNEALQIAFWSFINQTASINKRMEYSTAPAFLQGSDTYIISQVSNMYNRNSNQRKTINELLGLELNSKEYIQDGQLFFLSRGHLTARADGYYGAQQNSTYFMENMAPQWQSFNGGNWNKIEISVRNYASNNGIDLKVWTGVHGIATLPHSGTNKSTELYLYVNGSTKALPVPEIYYKVVHDPKTELGVVLIGVNNPYKSTFSPLCTDVSSKISWLTVNKTSQQDGFSYVCTLTSFRNVVTSLPSITDKGLLL